MTRTAGFLTLVALVLTASIAAGQEAPRAPASLSGEWLLTTVIFGNERGERMNLQVEKGKVTGSVYRRGKRVPLAGKIEGAEIQFALQEGESKSSYTGRLVEGEISGKVTVTGGNSWRAAGRLARASRGLRAGPPLRAADAGLRARRISPGVLELDQAGHEDLAG